MLKNTFIHIPGIGPRTEQRFWDSRIYKWDDLLPNGPIHLSSSKAVKIASYLEESKQNLELNNPNYFSDLLPTNQHWRFFPEFRDSTVYLDIETTGLESWANEITTIALFDGQSLYYYINGHNLNDFPHDIQKYKVLVTYNGKTFDVPFIERYFGIQLDHAHIDLRYVLGSLGYRGGLKSCEFQLGINRGDLKDIDGFFAVLLWNDYRKNGNPKALETLLAYNIQDTVTLESLMITAYNLKIEATPFWENKLSEPVLPKIPFKADSVTVERIRKETQMILWQ